MRTLIAGFATASILLIAVNPSFAQDTQTLKYHDGSIYTGEVIDGKRNDTGTFTDPNGYS